MYIYIQVHTLCVMCLLLSSRDLHVHVDGWCCFVFFFRIMPVYLSVVHFLTLYFLALLLTKKIQSPIKSYIVKNGIDLTTKWA